MLRNKQVSTFRFPSPPINKTGWPWGSPLSAKPSIPGFIDFKEWPRITIVTPNYNYERFIEKTIRSVLCQGYPNLEFIVLDDGSTDNSISIIKKYSDYLSFRTSSNKGQSFRIQEGLGLSTGEIFNWLNSDDYLLPDSLWQVGSMWRRERCQLLIGGCHQVDLSGNVLDILLPKAAKSATDFLHTYGNVTPQPSTFISTELLKKVGGVRTDLKYLMDWELYFRLYEKVPNIKVSVLTNILSHSLLHPASKTQSYGKIVHEEYLNILQKESNCAEPKLRKLIYRKLDKEKAVLQLSQYLERGNCSTWTFVTTLITHPSIALSRMGVSFALRSIPLLWRKIKSRYETAHLRILYSLPEITLEEILKDKPSDVLPPVLDDICLNPYLGVPTMDDYTPLMSVAKTLKPRVIVEFGTAYGNTVANLLQHSPQSIIYTVNALSGMHTMQAFKLSTDDIGRVYKKLNLRGQVNLILENTLNIDLSNYLGAQQIDLAIIDACHETSYVLNDFEKIRPFMKKGGIVFFHDTHPSAEGHLAGSLTACQKLRAQGFDIRQLPLSWWAVWIAP